MDRYDWEWGRRMGGPAGSRYDRNAGYGGWWGRGYGGGPQGGQGGYSRYDGWYGGWQQEPRSGYRYSYGRRGAGGSRFGRQEPWEPGPPSGYGRQWSAAYGDRNDRYGGYDRQARYPAQPGPYSRRGAFDPFGPDPFADLPDAPRGHFDGYEPMDDEAIEAAAAHDMALTARHWRDEEPDDADVRDSVTECLREDGFIDADAIQVEVRDRVVTLRGEVKDYMEARYAWDDAWEAAGVRGVISKLTVPGAGRQEAPAGAAKKR